VLEEEEERREEDDGAAGPAGFYLYRMMRGYMYQGRGVSKHIKHIDSEQALTRVRR